MIDSRLAEEFSSFFVMALPSLLAFILALTVVMSRGRRQRVLTRAFLWSQPVAWLLTTAFEFIRYMVLLEFGQQGRGVVHSSA